MRLSALILNETNLENVEKKTKLLKYSILLKYLKKQLSYIVLTSDVNKIGVSKFEHIKALCNWLSDIECNE